MADMGWARPLMRPRHEWMVALLVALPLLFAAAARMPLFQDGASYLVEVMTTRSAVRHHRYPALLVQAPSIVGLKLAARAGLDARTRLRIASPLFNLAYAAVPFVALTWAWMLVRGRDAALIVWAVIVILLLNIINFSWVSEILIAMQLACPLMLAACQPKTDAFDRATIALLTPVVFLLHALVSLLFAGMAAGMILRGLRDRAARRRSGLLATLFLAAATARLLADAVLLSDYERGMLAAPQMVSYFSFTLEDALFLAAVALLAIGTAFRGVAGSRTMVALCLAIGAVAIWRTAANLIAASTDGDATAGAWAAIILLIGSACTATAWLLRTGQAVRTGRAVLAVMWPAAAAVGSHLLVLPHFPLKSGTTVALAAAALALAGYDSVGRLRPPHDLRRLTIIHGAILFALLLGTKAAIWHAATARLDRTLATASFVCMERSDPALSWLSRPPYTILDNWSLPSLTIVTPRAGDPRLALQAGDCALFATSGQIVIDPWVTAPARFLPFLYPLPEAGRGR